MRTSSNSSFAKPIVRLSITAIAICIIVMIVSISVLLGFKRQITEKVIGFSSDIQIANFDSNTSYEQTPIMLNRAEINKIKKIEGIKTIQPYILKAGLLKSENEIQGIVFKGIDDKFDFSFFKSNLKKGKLPELVNDSLKNEILISEKIANSLNIDLASEIRVYFIKNGNIRGRKLTVSGIYNAGFAEFDELFIIGNIKILQRINGWDENQVSGIDINIKNFDELNKISKQIYSIIGYNLKCTTVKQLYPQIFDWLSIQDINVYVILILLSLLSAITIISVLLILILERTKDIGILKAIGAKDSFIRKIFINSSIFILFNGLILGNIIGLSFALLQQKFNLIPLNEDSYFLSSVPIYISIPAILAINLSVIFICIILMVLPSIVIKYISPIKAIIFK